MRRSITVPSVRTLVQSFDTARYQQDTVADLMIDTAHARTEALLALLFGRTIVVPAGQVAESPAFIALFCEIMNAQAKVRKSLYAQSTYRPFILALEDGFKNYDDFVEKFFETSSVNPLIEKQAHESNKSKSEHLAIMQRAYLDRDFAALDRSHLGYGHFASLVADEFGRNSDAGARPVLASRRRLYTGEPEGLGKAMRELLESVAAKDVATEEVAQMREATDAILADMAQAGGGSSVDGPHLRGSWYARAARFGELWDVARIWLDHALYREFSVRYDIQIPSFFLQEVVCDRRPPELVLAFAGETVLSELSERKRLDGPAVSAATDRVDWETLWEMVADPRFQASLLTLNAELDSALLKEQHFLDWARRDLADDPQLFERRVTRAREIRTAETRNAVNGHIDRVLSDLRDYLITNKAGRLYVTLKKAPKAIVEHPMFKIFGRGGGKGLGKEAEKQAGEGIKHYLAGPAAAESATSSIAVAAGASVTTSMAAIGVKYAVDYVLRPTSVFGLPERNFRDEADRMNYWLGAAHYV